MWTIMTKVGNFISFNLDHHDMVVKSSQLPAEISTYFVLSAGYYACQFSREGDILKNYIRLLSKVRCPYQTFLFFLRILKLCLRNNRHAKF